jgi:outer membrane protein assembly factor BamB
MKIIKLYFLFLSVVIFLACNKTAKNKDNKIESKNKSDSANISVKENDWKCFGANACHTAEYKGDAPQLPLQVRWSFTIGSSAKTYAVAFDSTIFLAANDLNYNFYALNEQTGTKKWTFHLGNLVWATPALADKTVYVACNDGSFFALDARTGKEKWKYKIGAEIESSPVVADGFVYFGSNDNFLYALDAHTGKEKWKYKTGAKIESSPAVANGLVYFGSNDDFLYALDAHTGKEKWKYKTGAEIESSPAVANGLVYFSSDYNFLYALDAQTGKEKWKFEADNSITNEVAIAGKFLFLANDNFLYTLDAQTGKRIWRYNVIKYSVCNPIISDKKIFISTSSDIDGEDVYFYALGAEEKIQDIDTAQNSKIEELALLDKNVYNNYIDFFSTDIKDFFTNEKITALNLFDESFKTSWSAGFIKQNKINQLYLRIPKNIPDEKIILNIFPGSGRNTTFFHKSARPKKIEVSVLAAFHPEAYTTEVSDLYLLIKKSIKDTVFVLADSFGLQSFKLNLNHKKIDEYLKKGLQMCKQFKGSDFSASENSNVNFFPALILKLTIKSAYSGKQANNILISEIFFNNRFITPFPDDFSQIENVYIKDDSLLCVDYQNRKSVIVYKDASADFTYVDWFKGSNYAILHYVDNDNVGQGARTEEDYKLIDLKNKKDVSSEFQRVTGAFVYFLTLEKDESGKIFLNTSDNFKIELK